MKDGVIRAVLTGDLIRSSSLSASELKSVRQELLASIEQIKSWKKNLVLSNAEFFRGDSWQLLLSTPSWAMRVAFFLRARLKARGISDTRISIGIGPVSEIAKHRVSLSRGEAFALSGHALDHLGPQNRMAVSFANGEDASHPWIQLSVQLCDALVQEWKPRQAKIISLVLLPEHPSHEQIARQLKPPISRQAVTKAIQGAYGLHALAMIEMFERLPWKEKDPTT